MKDLREGVRIVAQRGGHIRPTSCPKSIDDGVAQCREASVQVRVHCSKRPCPLLMVVSVPRTVARQRRRIEIPGEFLIQARLVPFDNHEIVPILCESLASQDRMSQACIQRNDGTIQASVGEHPCHPSTFMLFVGNSDLSQHACGDMMHEVDE